MKRVRVTVLETVERVREIDVVIDDTVDSVAEFSDVLSTIAGEHFARDGFSLVSETIKEMDCRVSFSTDVTQDREFVELLGVKVVE